MKRIWLCNIAITLKQIYVDVQPIDLARGLRDRVKIMFFSSKATFNDNKEVNPLIINPIEEPNYPINSQSSRESINEY